MSHPTDYRAEPAEAIPAHVLTGFATRRVLVLGDVMLDRYVLGEVRRISPEAPIPVLRASQRRGVPGGAANVARNIASLGAHATLVGVVGEDASAGELEAVLRGIGQVAPILVRDPGRPTTVKTRFMSGSHQLLRLDEEESGALSQPLEDAVLAAFMQALPHCDIVVLSDYAKGVLTDRVLGEAIAQARAAGVPIVADPKRPTFAAYRHVTVLTPNLSEVARATGIQGSDDMAVELAGRAACAQADTAAVIVTRSEKGLTLVRHEGPTLHVPTRARAVADVSGAGDTFVAALAIMLGGGASLDDAAVIANLAAGIAVGKAGTAAVEHAELAAALHQRELMGLDTKVAELGPALARVARWRAEGARIGFTNGCFDLIHPGHIRLLAEARRTCDRLVVGLNSDASVSRLKGPTRPVQNETARATVMASIAAADLVVIFTEDTPERLIEAVCPDVLIKGADYRVDQVVGGAFVQQHGGRVVLIDLEDGHSTTNTIRRMALPDGVAPV